MKDFSLGRGKMKMSALDDVLALLIAALGGCIAWILLRRSLKVDKDRCP